MFFFAEEAKTAAAENVSFVNIEKTETLSLNMDFSLTSEKALGRISPCKAKSKTGEETGRAKLFFKRHVNFCSYIGFGL